MNRSTWATYVVPLFLGALITAIAIATQPFGFSHLIAAVSALAAVVTASLLALCMGRVCMKKLTGGFIGLFAGCLLGLIFTSVLNIALPRPTAGILFLRLAIPLLSGYVGLIAGLAKSSELPASLDAFDRRPQPSKILDTSVLIDGRICEIAQSGFLEGPLVIPRFVLHELQAIADSADSARRARGRRGLDVVQRLQALPTLQIQLSSQDFPGIREVDLKLIEFAKLTSGGIVTNDFNLNKLAQVQGIQVLNINQLASSLKPVVLPGEIMRVFVLKEGKEQNQGIAYLDDGTMVVVDNARRQISKTIEIAVTSVIQTTAGKMIFGRFDERALADRRPVAAASAAG